MKRCIEKPQKPEPGRGEVIALPIIGGTVEGRWVIGGLGVFIRATAVAALRGSRAPQAIES